MLFEETRKIAKDVLGRRGFATLDIIANWRAIVGDDLSSISIPLEVKFPRGKGNNGILKIKVNGSAFAQYIAYKKPLILEKVNDYFGYEAVVEVKVIQGLYEEKEETLHEQTFSSDSITQDKLSPFIQNILTSVADDNLRKNLQRLAKTYIKP